MIESSLHRHRTIDLMVKRNLTTTWIGAPVLLLAIATTALSSQMPVNLPAFANSLDAEVEALVASTKPADWENVHACLYYALAGQHLLAKHGIHSTVRVGAVIYAPGTSAHHGISPHAWLETPGFIIDYSTLPRWGITSVIPRDLVASHPAAVYPGVTQVLILYRPADPDLMDYLSTHRARFDGIVND